MNCQYCKREAWDDDRNCYGCGGPLRDPRKDYVRSDNRTAFYRSSSYACTASPRLRPFNTPSTGPHWTEED